MRSMIEKVSFLVHVICSCRYWTKLSTKSLSGEQEFYFGVLKAFTDQLMAHKYFSAQVAITGINSSNQ